MIIIGEPQGSPAWRAARVGRITASCAAKLLTPSKLQPSAQADAYADVLAAEWLMGQPLDEEWQGNQWTDRGTALESEARRAFAIASGLEARTVGFILRKEGAIIGASPDAMVYDGDTLAGVLELKCPKLSTHLGYWRAGALPRAYRLQVQFQLWVTDLPRAWFQSYHPDGPDVLVCVERDDDCMGAFDEHVTAAADALMDYRERLRAAGCEPRDPLDWATEQADRESSWEGAA